MDLRKKSRRYSKACLLFNKLLVLISTRVLNGRKCYTPFLREGGYDVVEQVLASPTSPTSTPVLTLIRGIRLYVNRGIGCLVVPLRFRSRPEITLHLLAC